MPPPNTTKPSASKKQASKIGKTVNTTPSHFPNKKLYRLTDEEKIKLCEVVSNSHADYIKTSTGFAGGGATREDVALMAAHMTNGKKIKAAGGIASLQDAEDFLKLGADRLGTSRIVKAVKELEAKGEL